MSILTKIRRGTVRGDEDLCRTCGRCHRYREAGTNEEVTICSVTERPMRRVSECNRYFHSGDTSIQDMYAIAWELGISKSGRIIGFMSPKEFKQKLEEGKVEEPDDIRNPL